MASTILGRGIIITQGSRGSCPDKIYILWKETCKNNLNKNFKCWYEETKTWQWDMEEQGEDEGWDLFKIHWFLGHVS